MTSNIRRLKEVSLIDFATDLIEFNFLFLKYRCVRIFAIAPLIPELKEQKMGFL